MPISPDDARRKSRERPEYKALCKRIDNMLIEGGRTFACELLGNVRALDIIEAYADVGWRVRSVSDWREGDYLKFEDASIK